MRTNKTKLKNYLGTAAVITLLSIALVLSVGMTYAFIDTSEKSIHVDAKDVQLDDKSKQKLLPEDMPETVTPKIDPLLLREIEKKPHEMIPVIIMMKEQQKTFDIQSAKSFTTQSQQSLVPSLSQINAENITQHWIINAVSASILAGDIDDIALRSDVKIVWLDRKVTIPEPIETGGGEADYGDYIINADEMWDLGYYGDDMKIAILDSGVDKTHPMLDDLDDDPTTYDPKVIAEKCFTFEEDPTDVLGHGTACAGIAAGTPQEANVSVTDWITLASNIEITESEVHTYILEVSERTVGMTISLLCRAFMNDLDLTATDPVGNTYNGTARPSYEYIDIELPMEGNWTINVTGTNISYTECYNLFALVETEKPELINITGVAPKALLLNGKVISNDGHVYDSWVIRGIEWALDEDADVISLSFGGWDYDSSGRDPMSMAVTNAWDSGVVVTVGAGNEGAGEVSIAYPACAKKAIAAAASDVNDKIPSFSSRGPTSDGRVGIDVAAPGVEVWFPVPGGGYGTSSGTSGACPHVAGAAALLLQAYQDLTPEELEKALKNGADWLAGITMHSGDQAWFSGSGYNLDNTLDHEFNLTGVSSATLKFWTGYVTRYTRYVEGQGWAFGYVEVSTDGGTNWTTLDTYTGYQTGWTQKNYDLTPYAGNVIVLRFEYITVSTAHSEGWYLDDIEIPEIGFFDDVESGPGSWIPDGWAISEPYPYDIYEQGSGRLDVKGAYDALTGGTLVNPSQWFAGVVYPGSYTATFTVTNNDATAVTMSLSRSNMADTQDKDGGNWIMLNTTSFTVPAGASAAFNATMNVPGTAKGAYKGKITVNNGVKDINIPVSVNVMQYVDNTTVEVISGTVDEDYQILQLGDYIYYTLDVQQGVKNLNLTLNWTDPENNLDLWLVNPDGMLTAVSWCGYPESISVHNPEAGRWTVVIHTFYLNTSPAIYTLTLNATGQDLLEITDFTIEPENVSRDDIATFDINITNKGTSAIYVEGLITILAITEYGREDTDVLFIEGTLLSPGANTWTESWVVWPSPGSYEATTQIFYYPGDEVGVVEKTISFNIIEYIRFFIRTLFCSI